MDTLFLGWGKCVSSTDRNRRQTKLETAKDSHFESLKTARAAEGRCPPEAGHLREEDEKRGSTTG